MFTIKTLSIVSVLFIIYYYFNQTQVENFSNRVVNSLRSTSRVPSIRVDKDCEMTNWSKCDPYGKQTRNIVSNYQGFGKKCEPLVQNCTVPKNIGRWEGCHTSNQCNGNDLFCRVGDNRCITDGDCNWANSADRTSRDCKRIEKF